MRNNLSVALTVLSVEELAKEDLSSTNLVFMCPLSVEEEERNISNLASKKICWIAGSTVGQDGLLRQFLYNDAGILEKDSFDVYPFYLFGNKVLLLSYDALQIPSRWKVYNMAPDLLLISSVTIAEEIAELRLKLKALAGDWKVNIACTFYLSKGKRRFGAFSAKGEEVRFQDSALAVWRV
ncbi:hypothetical protein [Acetomicrobium sp.]|uniref:hypothetical protein n=1 Tax=Acetomicrobium sp. TaxID=1872099 RepID=UPI001BD071D4|nr:hypothetical protein [Acetomicrobium sp.]